jgi:hypothetical protein
MSMENNGKRIGNDMDESKCLGKSLATRGRVCCAADGTMVLITLKYQ